jgi:hypothetical protein
LPGFCQVLTRWFQGKKYLIEIPENQDSQPVPPDGHGPKQSRSKNRTSRARCLGGVPQVEFPIKPPRTGIWKRDEDAPRWKNPIAFALRINVE